MISRPLVVVILHVGHLMSLARLIWWSTTLVQDIAVPSSGMEMIPSEERDSADRDTLPTTPYAVPQRILVKLARTSVTHTVILDEYGFMCMRERCACLKWRLIALQIRAGAIRQGNLVSKHSHRIS